MTPNNSNSIDRAYASLKEEAELQLKRLKESGQPNIYIGMATCGRAAGATETKEAFEETLAKRNVQARIVSVGCMGHCYAEPLVMIEQPDFPTICYHKITPGKAKILVQNFLEGGDPCFEYMLGAMEPNDMFPCVMDFPRFGMEKRVVMEHCGLIDPDDIYQYIARGGYSGLVKSLKMKPDEIITQLRESGLRGRGGAGFPTWKKWAIAREANSDTKIVICNGDEGDPGAYMDRTILESNPHQVLEGLAICALAVGAKQGIFYIRAEYPLAIEKVNTAIKAAREKNLLGPNILGSGFSLEISLFQGSGAFVCGEETALIKSIEGERGMPQARPPFPALKGVWELPTVINNVKTLASVPPIIAKGADWYAQIGTENSTGTAIFSIVGDVVHPGLVEIPMGTTLRELIFDICGGIPNRKKFKAVQIGGPSGGCLPEKFLDWHIDFDSLKEAGAMMGSGGMVVMNEESCMVEVARYFLDFTQKESCGKCTFCRIGTKHLLDMLEAITNGEGTEEHLKLLQTLGEDIKAGSLCGLGKTAPNPVLTTLRFFREEYEAHVSEKRCPALMCRNLIAYYIDLDKCARGCDACVGSCPVEAIFTTKDRKKSIDQSKCVKCGECMTACPPEYDAVRKVSPPDRIPPEMVPQMEG